MPDMAINMNIVTTDGNNVTNLTEEESTISGNSQAQTQMSGFIDIRLY